MRRHYSRLAKLEEKKNIRSAFFFVALSVVSIVLLFTFGLPVVIKFAGFLTDIKKSGTPVEISDTTPPAPPRIESLPEATSALSLEIKGNTESGATVILFLNSKEKELLADKDGNFSYTFSLSKGENRIFARAKDSSGNESQETQTFTVIFDNEPPKLEINSPENGSQYFGSKERQIVINGTTEPGASVNINDRVVAVEESGEFTFATTLSEGENVFKIIAKDKAENSQETSLTLHFTP